MKRRSTGPRERTSASRATITSSLYVGTPTSSMRRITGLRSCSCSSTPSTFQNMPSTASARLVSRAGTRLKPTLIGLTLAGSAPASRRIVLR